LRGTIRSLDPLGHGIVQAEDGSKFPFLFIEVLVRRSLVVGQPVIFSVRRVQERAFQDISIDTERPDITWFREVGRMNRRVRKALKNIYEFPPCMTAIVKTRNFTDRFIKNHMQHCFDDATQNGEDWILTILGSSCRRFVDVGANRGDFSAAFLRNSPEAEGLLFDPSEVAYEKLTTRFAEQPTVRVIRKAVSDRPGRAAFFEEPEAGLGSSLVKNCAILGSKRIEVEVTTLDAEVAHWGGADYVKIDAEGHDFPAMVGASTCLSRRSIRFLQFEYHNTWAVAGATLRAALNFLTSFSYTVYLLKGEALYQTNYEAYGEYFYYSNYLAVRTQDEPAILKYVKGRI
jgi:FkbM family methyltransferase